MNVKLIEKEKTKVRDFGNGLTLSILLDKMTGAKNLDLGTVTIPAKNSTAMHKRDFEEVIYMLRGEGKLKLEDGTEYILKKGDCVLIPEGIMHAHANDSDEELEQLYIFAPQAGSEIQKSLRDLPIKLERNDK